MKAAVAGTDLPNIPEKGPTKEVWEMKLPRVPS